MNSLSHGWPSKFWPRGILPPLRRVDHLEQCKYSPPVSHGAHGLQLRCKVFVRQLAAGYAVGVVEIDVAPTHRKGVRRRAQRIQTGHGFGAGSVL